MRKAAVLSVAMVLAACQNPDIDAYHHDAAHPYRVTEASTRMPLAPIPADRLSDAVRAFAAERPNEGSSFIVSAPTDVAIEARSALLRAGIDARDIRVVPEGHGEIIRTDRFARVENCNPPVGQKERNSYLFGIEDGWRRDNANSRMFGCSVRRNIVEMVDDPRSLMGPVKAVGRDGGRAATVYETWAKGQNPAAKINLETGPTTTSTLAGGRK